MRSILNTTRQVTSRSQAPTSEYAILYMGGRGELAQSVSGNYGREIRPIYELGSPNVVWVGGHEQGTLELGRIVGKRGFFAGLGEDECGVVRPVSINLGSGPCVTIAAGGLHFHDAMIERLSFSMNVGSLEITETISMRVANMSRA
jgi:hypothetical protein